MVQFASGLRPNCFPPEARVLPSTISFFYFRICFVSLCIFSFFFFFPPFKCFTKLTNLHWERVVCSIRKLEIYRKMIERVVKMLTR